MMKPTTIALFSLLILLTVQSFDISSAHATVALPQQACLPYQSPEHLMAEYFSELTEQTEKFGGDTNAIIGGIQFKNEAPVLLWALRELVAKRTGQDPSADDKIANLAKIYKISRSCTKVICAANQIFGDGVGQRMIYLQARYDLNSSKIVFKNASDFRVAELNSVILGVRQYPERLLPLERSQKLTKFSRGYTLALYGDNANNIAANATMTFFDTWSEEAPRHRLDAVVHELGHNMSARFFNGELLYSVTMPTHQDLDNSPEWLALSGWDKKTNRFSISRKKFVSDYAQTNPAEDFAESVTHYLLYPQNFLKIHKEKYEFIKKYVFGGQEFLSGKCKQTTILDEFKNIHAKTMLLESTARIKDLADACVNDKHDTFDARKTFGCLDFHVTKQILSEVYNDKSELIPNELINPMTRGFVVHFPLVYAQILEFAEANSGYSLYEERMAEIRKRSLLEYSQIKAQEATAKMKGAWLRLIEIINEMNAE